MFSTLISYIWLYAQGEVAGELGIPVMCQTFWLCARRTDGTFRPHRPLTAQEETQSVGQLTEASNFAELKLYLHVETAEDGTPIRGLKMSKEKLLLFSKYYDPSHEKLRFIGSAVGSASEKLTDELSYLKELWGCTPDEEIEIFNEIRFEPHVICEKVDENSTYGKQFKSGDIICIQKAFKDGSHKQFRFPDVSSFLQHKYNSQVVPFRFLKKANEGEFKSSSSLSSSFTYIYDVFISFRDELANIMECLEDNGMLVLPLFYQVDPSDVRYQKGTYAIAFDKHKTRYGKEKIDKWRVALKKAADRSGSHFKLDTESYTMSCTMKSMADNIFDFYMQLEALEEVAREFGMHVMYLRFWWWAKCHRDTLRPYRPLTLEEEKQSVGQLSEMFDEANNAELKLYMELETGLDFRPIPPPKKSKEDLLLFFKLYDPSLEKLRYIGKAFVKDNAKPKDILEGLKKIVGFALNEKIELFKFEDGDVICYQKPFLVRSGEPNCCPDVPLFFKCVYNREV
ncbi:hypothetical protein RIF29_21325 [Crotalaria pallida]|uniref:Uncharacterized protein n=1 Tax=Crotalaria pallida TaxID=3830 RepID=A0AAN9FBC2_CROPI